MGQHTESDITNLACTGILNPRNVLKLEGRITAEQNLRGVLNGSAPGIDEFLNEDLAEYSVRFFPKDGAEYDGHTVVAGLDVDSLLFSVVNSLDLSTLPNTLWRLLGRELGCFLSQGVVFLVGLLERRGHSIALQQGNLHDKGIASLLFGGKVLKVDLDGEVITGLGRDNEIAIFAVEDLLSAVANEILEASDLERDEDLGLGFGGRDVEDDAVKVGDSLVDVDGGSSVGMRGDGGGSVSASSGAGGQGSSTALMVNIPRSKTLSEYRLDQDVLVVEQQHDGDLQFLRVYSVSGAVEVVEAGSGQLRGLVQVSGVGP